MTRPSTTTSDHRIPSGAPRPAAYVTVAEALRYANRFNLIYGTRGWSSVLMEENLPGWTLSDVIHLLTAQRLITHRKGEGWIWRRPKVVGVVIEGDTVVLDTGKLVHPAKTAHRRFVDIGTTKVRYVRHLLGDSSTLLLHVRTTAYTDEERLLHEVMRETYLASDVRPDLIFNVSTSLIDPFDPPFADVAHVRQPFDEAMNDFVRCYQQDLFQLLVYRRARHGKIVLVTLNTHDHGDAVEIAQATKDTLPPQLHRDATKIRLRELSLRADTLEPAHRAKTVARLVRLLGSKRSAALWTRGSIREALERSA